MALSFTKGIKLNVVINIHLHTTVFKFIPSASLIRIAKRIKKTAERSNEKQTDN